jgi:DMSO/TMAO reductase YedYZ molybdopterin-dependent catalytic subunit
MPKGRYGTSINYFTAMDPACDVLLAWEQNGARLTPDHGYPLRLIIPGYIGGRMIKWLNEITVRDYVSGCVSEGPF